jgi:oxygen-independent coproporphyrinogen-3 oxidase
LRHFTDTGGPARFWNPRDFYAWQDAVTARDLPGSGHEILTPSQERMEQVMLGLRTDNGICLNTFGPDFHNLLNSLAARGLGHFFYSNPTDSPGIQRFRLTRSGMVCLDSIVDALVRKIL